MKLKELRMQKGVTQKNAAEFICCSALAYSRYEREVREPDIWTLCRLADFFEVSIDYLVGRENKHCIGA